METEMRVTGIGDLSDDMMVETLTRLPLKSLMRFRSVCKSWYSLIKDPNFIYKHLKNDDNMHLMVNCTCEKDDDRDPFNDLVSYLSIFPDKTLTNLHFQDLEPIMSGLHIGPYNGLFCLMTSYSRINLWNVSLNEYRVVPTCRPHLPCCTKIRDASVALGLDPMTNNFKLVLIFILWNDKINSYHDFSHVAVYNLSTNSWRDFEGFEMRFDYMFNRIDNVYLNGFCHWVVRRPDSRKAILLFSMSKEVFQELNGPNVPETQTWVLGAYDDYLSLLCSEESAHSFDLWMMKEGTWTKQLTFGPFIETYEPLGFWGKCEFFLQSSNNRLILYDSRYEEMRDLGITGLWFSVHVLKESLITIRKENMELDEIS